MKHVTRVALVFCSFICFASAALGQTTSSFAQQPPPSAAPSFTCTVSFGPLLAMPVPGSTAPYSAMQESSNVQTLADGTHISHKPFTQKIFRDSQGRTRTERPICLGPRGISDVVAIEIRDPVSGFSYVLDEQNQVAHRFALQASRPATAPAPLANSLPPQTIQRIPALNQDASKPSSTTEWIGSQTIEGVPVEGTRTTEIIPEGSQGNDRPITVVRERWTSPDLRIAILIKDNDPRQGESETRLTNIDLSNPILALFQPPPGYKIVDETDRVTITFTRN
jgi:hypothetical protein